jgi:hypothetical protein
VPDKQKPPASQLPRPAAVQRQRKCVSTQRPASGRAAVEAEQAVLRILHPFGK